MKRTEWEQAYHGDVILPKMDGYKIRCCDCGLVHRLIFAVVKDGRKRRVAFTVEVDNRATAAWRRWHP